MTESSFGLFPGRLPAPFRQAYCFLGMAQSIPTVAISFVLLEYDSVTPSRYNLIYALWFQCGLIRPFVIFISDQFPIRGQRRRPFLIIFLIGCGLSSLWMALAQSVSALVIAGVGVYASWACAEAVVDSLVVEWGNAFALQQCDLSISMPEAEAESEDSARRRSALNEKLNKANARMNKIKAAVQGEAMLVRTCATIIAYTLSIILLKLFEPRIVMLCNLLTFIPSFFASWAIDEKKVLTSFYGLTAVTEDGQMVRKDAIEPVIGTEALPNTYEEAKTETVHFNQLRSGNSEAGPDSDLSEQQHPNLLLFWKAKLKQMARALRLSFLPVTFIVLYYSVPNSADTYYAFLYSGTFAFEAWQADLFTLISLIASLLGTLCYSRFLTHHNLKYLFVLVTFLTFAMDGLKIALSLNIAQKMDIPPYLYVPVSNALSSFVAGIAVMLPVVLAHTYTPRIIGLEGSMFSVYQAADRVGVIIASVLAASITEGLNIERGHFQLLWLFILLCASLEFLPLLTMPILLANQPQDTLRSFKNASIQPILSTPQKSDEDLRNPLFVHDGIEHKSQ